MNTIPIEVSNIFTEFITQIRPTPDELSEIQEIINFIRQKVLSSKIPKGIIIDFIEAEGSTGIKQTALRNSADIDLFIALNPRVIERQEFNSRKARKAFLHELFKDLNKHWLSSTLSSAGLTNISLSYAEHPYLTAAFRGMDLDIVLCFNISSDYLIKNGPITAVDRSPHHSRYIRESLSEIQKDEVRLLKAFFKANQCYGDKSAVGRTGFIGYSAELLIAHYGTLWNVFKNFGEIRSKVIATPESIGSNPFSLAGKKFEDIRSDNYPNDFLIILDPTDPKRNVGSSISYRAFYCLEERIIQFFSTPSEKFLKMGSLPSVYALDIKDGAQNSLFFVDFKISEEDHYTKIRDKLYSLMDKFIQFTSREDTNEPRFIDVIGELLFDSTKGVYNLAFYCKNPVISKKYPRRGPKIGDEPHYSNFKAKHTNCIEKDGWLWLELSRKYTKFDEILDDFFTQNPVKNIKIMDIGNFRTQDCSLLAQQSMANLLLNIIPFCHKYPILSSKKSSRKKNRKKRKSTM